MKETEKLYDAITNLPDERIEAAQRHRFARRWSARLRRMASIAAALVLAVGVGWFLSSGGLQMAGSGTDSSAADAGDSNGSAAGGGQESAIGDGAAGAVGEPTFTDDAGPILPLTLAEESAAITAEREVALDFSGYGAESDFWEDRYRIAVTDRYVLTNAGETDETVTLLYPLAGSFNAMDAPELTADGAALETAVYVGKGVDLSEEDVLSAWSALLEDVGYLADAMDGPADLTGTPAIVYTVSGQYGPEGDDAATLALEFTYDPTETTLLQYGFNGMSRGDGDVVKYSSSGFVRHAAGDWYLIVVGEDIQSPVLQGYEDGGCDPGEELSAVGGTLTRRETTLDEILRLVAADYLQGLREGNSRAWRDVPFEAFYAAVSDGVVEDAHYLPLLEEFLFSQVRLTDRVVWFAAQVTVPAGGSVEVTADYTKSASLNFGPPDMDYKDLCGYSLLPQAGSSLTFTSQTAVLTGGEDLSLYGGNLNLGETALTEERYALYVLQ